MDRSIIIGPYLSAEDHDAHIAVTFGSGGVSGFEEELALRREEAARKRRENALAKQHALAADDVFYPVPDEQKRCPKCNGKRFGALKPETSTTIEYIPGRFVRRTPRREKLACSCGECILVAPAPPKLIVGGHYGGRS